MNIKFVRSAKDDLHDIEAYIALRNPNAAKRVIARIAQTIKLLESFPSLGKELNRQGRRKLNVSGLPYSIYYFIENETDLIVTSVTHQKKYL